MLGQALTSARPDNNNQKINLINVGNERDTNRIPTAVLNQYISFADTEIDGILSQQYETPFRKCYYGQWSLEVDLNEYNQTVEISDSTQIVAGDEIIIRNDKTAVEETHLVASVVDQYSFTTEDAIETEFSVIDNVRVIRIAFPQPITQISARLACANIYDKYFSAQNSPNISEYGKELRKIAMQDINNILNGKTILREPCARRIGDRFASPYLDDNYALRDRGFATQDRNASQI